MAECLWIAQGINKLKGTDTKIFRFAKFETTNALSKEARQALKSKDFDTIETLCMLDISLIGNKFGPSLGMRARILQGVNNLKLRKSSGGHVYESTQPH